MSFFSKKPILRLFFVFVYACFAVWILIRDFAWLNILVSAFALLGSYVALAKSKLIKDKFSKNINDYSFATQAMLRKAGYEVEYDCISWIHLYRAIEENEKELMKVAKDAGVEIIEVQ